GPPALIEEPELKERLAIEEEAPDTGCVRADGDAAHAEIAVHLVSGREVDQQAVQEGIGRRPFVRGAYRNLRSGALRASDLPGAVEHRHGDARRSLTAFGYDRHSHDAVIEIRI